MESQRDSVYGFWFLENLQERNYSEITSNEVLCEIFREIFKLDIFEIIGNKTNKVWFVKKFFFSFKRSKPFIVHASIFMNIFLLCLMLICNKTILLPAINWFDTEKVVLWFPIDYIKNKEF